MNGLIGLTILVRFPDDFAFSLRFEGDPWSELIIFLGEIDIVALRLLGVRGAKPVAGPVVNLSETKLDAFPSLGSSIAMTGLDSVGDSIGESPVRKI